MFTMPGTAICRNTIADIEPHEIFYERRLNLIGVNKNYLEWVSELDPHKVYQVTAKDATAFIGTIPDDFRLAGVEETHHAAFRQLKKTGARSPRQAEFSSIAAYARPDFGHRTPP